MGGKVDVRQSTVALFSTIHKRNTHPIRIKRPKLPRSPRLGLQLSIRRDNTATPLVLSVKRLNPIHYDPHHNLVADNSSQLLIRHLSEVKLRPTTAYPRIPWRSS